MDAYIDGSLQGKQKSIIDAHLKKCEKCVSEIEDIELIYNLVRDYSGDVDTER